jgi:hypothetical protein
MSEVPLYRLERESYCRARCCPEREKNIDGEGRCQTKREHHARF